MRRQLNKITITFVLIALVPFGFVIHEFTSLNKNERIVREIYRNQLDAILYSVNQYSNDIVSSWANRVDDLLRATDVNSSSSDFRAVLETSGAVRYVYATDLNGKSAVFGHTDADKPAEIKTMLDEAVDANEPRIKRLLTYDQAGFRKLEPISSINLIAVFFVLDEKVKNYRMGALVLDLSHFINNSLGPKMQSVAQEQFNISVFKTGNNTPVYATASFTMDNAEAGEILNPVEGSEWHKRELWLLPDYTLAISLAGVTIEDLVRDRMITSLSILFVLILMLGAAIIFLYRNVRREMHLAQAKSEFVSNVSHEIRTPLSLISMYAETLEMNRITEEKKMEYYRIIARETGRLSQIVNRILNFSQIASIRKNYEMRSLDINTLCSEILESYALRLTESGFNYEFNAYPDLNKIQGDREAICEAIINLLDNAIKYSHDRKRIVMSTGMSDNHVYVEIRDEGIGIAKNYHQDIFEQFFRVPAGDVHTTKGSGLGLTLVKRIMDAHRGKISVESAPDKGSTFRLYFPVNRIHS